MVGAQLLGANLSGSSWALQNGGCDLPPPPIFRGCPRSPQFRARAFCAAENNIQATCAHSSLERGTDGLATRAFPAPDEVLGEVQPRTPAPRGRPGVPDGAAGAAQAARGCCAFTPSQGDAGPALWFLAHKLQEHRLSRRGSSPARTLQTRRKWTEGGNV